ncbi:DedA family protein [Corynebacterium senegalense]|uniref:DedA family protein n=1 Tax=Corynebacterium senegalense TaxID=2080750 RepID=UPI000E201C73|nr:DedA family protein [Corynebacterium senegalense]
MQSIIDWVVHLMEVLGAPGVGIAILLENLFPPIPSEVVLPLAGFTVSQGSLNFVAVFVWSVVGSVVGAYMLYGIGAWLGAERLRRIAHWMWLVRASDVDASLDFFRKYGRVSVFFGRLIPGIRSLISIPAGLDRMNLVTFGLWTTLGSAIWNFLLVTLGFYLGENWHLVEDYVNTYSNVVYVILILLIVGFLAFFIRREVQERREGLAPADSADTTK